MGSKEYTNLLIVDKSQLPHSNLMLVLVGLLLRWLTGLHSYSGQGSPPMFGDFEAQRHWMEITLNLPVDTWYFNTTENNLLYWGLDYPPLTAYHSLLCGYIAKLFVPDSVQLLTSHGHESYDHKYFMRLCVFVSDLLIYIPALLCFFSLKSNTCSMQGKASKMLFVSQMFVYSVAFLYPGLILIDHGHFQFNCISLGLFVWACFHLSQKNHILTCVLFCLSLNYKQMELYHALPFFFYYLGCLYKTRSIPLLFKLGTSVVATFSVLWFPFLNMSQFKQIIHRIFPIYRGVFEDKVANFWCSANVLYKFKTQFTNDQMAFICLCVTLVSILPSCIALFRSPTFTKFQLSLINVSLGFFLFSFHVHEKSILLVAIPVLLYLPKDPFPVVWFLLISTFSMFDLYVKDHLVMPSLVLMVLFYISIHQFVSQYCIGYRFLWFFFLSSMLGCVVLITSSLFLSPPLRYQHLFSLFISSYSFGHFALFFVYFYCKQFNLNLKLKHIKTL
uniref:Alpha-1,3-glucosyltransferase n=1 Tax=Cacopsylla melanoneura TaxID=428564 RepID=A0A8D8M0W9_9HEMI